LALPFIREFRLAGRDGDGVHAYLDDQGAFLGRGTPLLEKDASGRWRPRLQATLEWVLTKGYGVPVDLEWRMNGLAAVARALNKGDRSLAAIALVHAELPALPDERAAGRMAKADGLAKYSPDQPRVPAGHNLGPSDTRPPDITEEQAEAYLADDIKKAEDAVKANVTVPLTQGQYDALVSLAFNIGRSNFAGSKLVSVLNQGDYSGAAGEFANWARVGSKHPKWQRDRRTAERDMFVSGAYP